MKKIEISVSLDGYVLTHFTEAGEELVAGYEWGIPFDKALKQFMYSLVARDCKIEISEDAVEWTELPKAEQDQAIANRDTALAAGQTPVVYDGMPMAFADNDGGLGVGR